MAFNVKAKKENKEITNYELGDFKVSNVRVVTPTFISFTLELKGLVLYNMKLVETKGGVRFVAPPSQKAKNGNYYNVYSLYLSKEDNERVMDTVLAQLEQTRNQEEILFD